MRFEEALKAMREGKKVRQKGFKGWILLEDGLIKESFYRATKNYILPEDALCLSAILAEDWEIVDDNK